MVANKKAARGSGGQDSSQARTLAQLLPLPCPDCGGQTSPALCDPRPADRARGISAVITPATRCIRLAGSGEVRCGQSHRIAEASQIVDDALTPIHRGDPGRTLTLDPDSPLWGAVQASWLIGLAEQHGPAVMEQFNSIAVVELDQQPHLWLSVRSAELLPIAEPVLQGLAELLRRTPITTVQAARRATEAGTTALLTAEVQR